MGAQWMPSGQLRISVPTTYAHHRLLPLLPKFRALYPQVSVDIHISNRNIDFVAEGYDLAIRVRAQPDSSLIARLLEDAELVVAAPAYLQRAGTPQSLPELALHEVEQELADGALVEVLQPFGGRSRPFTLLYPHGRYVSHRVPAFVDFLLACRDEWAAS